MKKHLALLMAMVMVLAAFSGCAPAAAPSPSPTAAPTATPAADTVRTGLAIVSSLAKSKDAGEAEGLAQIDSTVVAVTVDSGGKIVSCVIDAAQTKINFNASGEITTPLTTEFKTKNELGYDYKMKAQSGIGKEWFEQAAAFADYVKGKTIQEVKGIAVNEEGYPTGTDLKTSVTINISGFTAAIEKAVENANVLGAKASDKLGIGVMTNIAKSESATEGTGLAQAYSTYVAVTTGADGVITSCCIDASQGNVNFDANGKITTDLTISPQTKNELGDDYGMKARSGLGKEWFEQAAAFAAYVTGKSAAEVEGIAVDETGHPTGTDLTSSVTITISDFKAALAKAAA